MRSIGFALMLFLAGCVAPEIRPSSESESPDGISRNEATDLALDALQDEAWEVVVVEAGPLGRVRPDWRGYDWGHGLSADVRVWRVVLVSGELSAEVVIDFVDGSVYSSTQGIAN